MAELRECPHCGGDAKLVDDPSDEVFALCSQCKSTTLHSWSGKKAREKAITAWNTRAYDTEMEAWRRKYHQAMIDYLSLEVEHRELCRALERGELVRVQPLGDDDYDGLKVKYRVFKARNGEQVENCFVLQPAKDHAALIALEAYAHATENQQLKHDLVWWADSIREEAALEKEGRG